MKKIAILTYILSFGFTANAQIEQLWKTDYQITSDTFNTFGYKTDSAGNFYLYGWQHNRVFLQKHDVNGAIEWTLNNDSSIANIEVTGVYVPTSNARLTDIVFDNESNIFITGLSSQQNFSDPHASSHFFISKINSSAAILWKTNYSNHFDSLGFTKWNHSPKIRLSKSNHEIYISYDRLYSPIICNGQYDTDFGIVQLDSSGNLLWNRDFLGDSTYCSKDIITSIFVKDTLITLSGFSTSPYPSQSKLINFKLDKNGNLINRAEEK